MKGRIALGFFILMILAAVFFQVRESFGVIRVENQKILYRDLALNRRGLLQFRDLGKENISDLDIERGVVLNFVEDILIQKELEKRGGGGRDWEKIVSETLAGKDLAKLEDNVSRLYGWSFEDFKKLILLPQSRRLMLAEEFEKENIDPDAWLEKRKKEAKISIYLLRWKWEDGEVKARY